MEAQGVRAQELRERRNKLAERILASSRSSPASLASFAILTHIHTFSIMCQDSSRC